MRLVLACLACTIGCGFHAPGVSREDAGEPDGGDAPDAPPDAPPDSAVPTRTRTGLIGLWEFNELDGAVVNDTSDGTKVPLAVNPGTVTFSASEMTPNGSAVVASMPAAGTHLNTDAYKAQAVTLEAWVVPAVANQGTAVAPVLVAGLCATVASRNISILQAGTHWVARVRTSVDKNGGPDLVSTADIVAGTMVHLVVVADATQRRLYVDGVLDVSDPAPGPLNAWDSAYRMALGNELSQNRQWDGSFALVALFKQALTSERVAIHHSAGPNAP